MEARKRYRITTPQPSCATLAARRRGTRHADLFQGLRLVMEQLGSDMGCPALALPALDSFLFLNGGNGAMPDLEGCELAYGDPLGAVRELADTVDANTLRLMDYRNIGARSWARSYESLLELHLDLNADAGTFVAENVSGSERKTTGSYHTPTSLIT